VVGFLLYSSQFFIDCVIEFADSNKNCAGLQRGIFGRWGGGRVVVVVVVKDATYVVKYEIV
jgi:hypothetical protein